MCIDGINIHGIILSHTALAELFERDVALFGQVSQWDCAREFVAASMVLITKKCATQTIDLQCAFIADRIVKCEGWVRILYIQSLIENNLMQKFIAASNDNMNAFNMTCFIVTNASKDQDVILKTFDPLQVIGAKTRSKNSTEAELARKTVEKLTNKSEYAQFIVSLIKSKCIRL